MQTTPVEPSPIFTNLSKISRGFSGLTTLFSACLNCSCVTGSSEYINLDFDEFCSLLLRRAPLSGALKLLEVFGSWFCDLVSKAGLLSFWLLLESLELAPLEVPRFFNMLLGASFVACWLSVAASLPGDLLPLPFGDLGLLGRSPSRFLNDPL